jgi:predicted AlkP superfamily phosphohydrolase/phosphomutase
MKEGKLPNFEKLASQGSFVPLLTTCPSMSPVAWSSFATGVDPSRHNIFDFLNRDLNSYLPILSSTHIGGTKRTLRIGRYVIPVGKPFIRSLRKSKPFWNVLGECYVPSHVLRVPITFPPEKCKNGAILSAMCVPDIRGTQGSFTFYTTRKSEPEEKIGGTVIRVSESEGKITSEIPGPPNPLSAEGEELKVLFTVELDRKNNQATISIDNESFALKPHVYSDWIELKFAAGLRMKISGICRFYINSIDPEFELYVTPINIDPEKAAMPISYPAFFADYLAKMQGKYATLGLAEDTWALNERIIDEEAFLEQVYRYQDEREEMLLNSLKKNRHGLTACVFDATDRVQHMFFRYMDDDHPANAGKDTEKCKNAIEDIYRRSDEFLGRVMDLIDDKTVLIVMSDHGFKPFKRGVNLNAWALREGYMKAENGKVDEYLRGVDWANTKMYAFGLSGIYINRKGREGKGIVGSEEYVALKRELKEKLTGLKDGQTGEVAIKDVFDTVETFGGPYAGNGPDLIIGYNVGYRASWDAALGKGGNDVIEDNTKSWSGDHCIDHRLVPGVCFSNRKISENRVSITDIGPSVLDLFGVRVPPYMQGKPVFGQGGE